MVQKNTGIDFSVKSEITNKRLLIPFCQDGFGFRELEQRRSVHFAGAVAKSVPSLIDRAGKAKNITITGRLSMLSISNN